MIVLFAWSSLKIFLIYLGFNCHISKKLFLIGKSELLCCCYFFFLEMGEIILFKEIIKKVCSILWLWKKLNFIIYFNLEKYQNRVIFVWYISGMGDCNFLTEFNKFLVVEFHKMILDYKNCDYTIEMSILWCFSKSIVRKINKTIGKLHKENNHKNRICSCRISIYISQMVRRIFLDNFYDNWKQV